MRIGVLLPQSNYIPGIGKDLIKCLRHGMRNTLEGVEIFIENGGYNVDSRQIADKIESLIIKDDVQLLIAPLNVGLFSDIEPILSANRVPLISLWLGEDVFFEEVKSEFIFSNGINLWQSAWMSGYYAARELGKRVATFNSFYDGAYGMTMAHMMGIHAAGGAQIYSGVTHRNSRTEDATGEIRNGLIENPDVITGFYSNKEAISFLEDFWQLGYRNEQLLANYFMVEDDVLGSVGNRARGLRTISNWHKNSAQPENVEFREWFMKELGRKMHCYGLLAYESGLILSDGLNRSPQAMDAQHLISALKSTTIQGPRGETRLYQLKESDPREYLFEVQDTDDGQEKQLIKELKKPREYYESLAWVKANFGKTGWKNPYLIA